MKEIIIAEADGSDNHADLFEKDVYHEKGITWLESDITLKLLEDRKKVIQLYEKR